MGGDMSNGEYPMDFCRIAGLFADQSLDLFRKTRVVLLASHLRRPGHNNRIRLRLFNSDCARQHLDNRFPVDGSGCLRRSLWSWLGNRKSAAQRLRRYLHHEYGQLDLQLAHGSCYLD